MKTPRKVLGALCARSDSQYTCVSRVAFILACEFSLTSTHFFNICCSGDHSPIIFSLHNRLGLEEETMLGFDEEKGDAGGNITPFIDYKKY